MMLTLAMNGFTSRSVLFSLVSSLALTLAPHAVAQDAGAVSVAASESARRKMAVRDAVQKIQEARLAYTAGRYGDAVDCYRAALKLMPAAPSTEKQVKFIKDSLADALVAKAMDYRKVGRLDEAVSFLKEAQQVSPGHKFAAAELEKTLDPVRTNPALTPRHIGNVGEVNRLLALAFGYYDLGNFDKARETFDAVLKIDAHNTAAQRGKEMVTNRQAAYYKTARDSFRAKALNDVDRLWEEHQPVEEPLATAAAAAENTAAEPQPLDVEAGVVSALKEMIIPGITFEEATIQDVQDALMGQISRFEGAGIRAPRPINVLTDFGPPDSDAYKRVMESRVNLKMNNVSVFDLLPLIDRQLGITHYITPLGVQFMLSGRDFGPIVERTYTVPPHFFDISNEDAGDEEDGDFSSAPTMLVKRVNPIAALKSMGISFPEGASAHYVARTRTLTVRNTMFNLQEIEELVSIPLSTDRAVVLNVMAMEIEENDLNELGFEWLFNISLNPRRLITSGALETISNLSETEVAVDASAKVPSSRALRSGNLVLSADNIDNLVANGSAVAYGMENAQQRKAPGIFSFRGVWKHADVSMIMRGASQKKGTDIMTNPRIVFTPGREEQVVYANVREMFYPESYTSPQIPKPGAMAVAAPAHPETFVRFGLSEDMVGGVGTVMQIHEASIDDDGQSVTLALTLTTNELEGFVNWGNPITGVIVNRDEDGNILNYATSILTDNKILMPIFKRHMENTKLTVGSGAVVVLGGLKESRTVRYQDKLPVLGDLPMVGRLFRSEGEEKIRKAYLVFVKVDIVDPTGRVIGTGQPAENVTDL